MQTSKKNKNCGKTATRVGFSVNTDIGGWPRKSFTDDANLISERCIESWIATVFKLWISGRTVLTLFI